MLPGDFRDLWHFCEHRNIFSRRFRQKFSIVRAAGWHPNSPATPWGGSPPRPLGQKICYSDCTENCPLSPLRAPRRFRNPRFPFTYRFAARVPSDSKGSECQWNPYSRGRLGPAKSEDRKGGEGKTDANLTIFFSTCCAWHALCAPCEHPGGFGIRKSASNSGHSPLRG